MNNNIITFDASVKKDILSFFGKTVDEHGFLVEKEDFQQKVITQDGEEIKFDDFAGIRKGSEIFIKSDLPSLIDLTDKLG
ncbi:MAG: hypothetical protein K0A90_08650 [Methanosarcinaceae archaeon]|nr:hypothetical protein [Methanosarcinaceae archaeon]